jgi:excinuclease ABC subunit C
LASEQDYAKLLDRVELFLSGRSRELIRQLQEAMQQASRDMKFEEAACLRDQLHAIARTVEQQSVVLPQGGDADVIGIASVLDGLALGVLFVRGGKLLDKNSFYWPGLTFEEAPELLLSFLGQFYGPRLTPPARIVVPWLEEMAVAGVDEKSISDKAALENMLSEWRQAHVRLSLPKNKAERALLNMAELNAVEAARRKDPADRQTGDLLAVIFQHPQAINRIECVDVSHTGGKSTRVGMVVFQDAKPLRNANRAYAIDALGDDLKALGQWAQRRIADGEPWPDLLLIDGGRSQIAAVERVFSAHFNAADSAASALPFVLAGIAKAHTGQGRPDRRAGNIADRIFIPRRVNALNIHPGSPELLFLQHVRDTAHNHALAKHKKARNKKTLDSEITRLPGIGEHTAKLLWTHFHSVEEMLHTDIDQLIKIPGIGKARAQTLLQRLKTLQNLEGH